MEKVNNIFAAVFDIDPKSINDDLSPQTLEKWDSLGHMNLITALEEELSITFSDDEISEMLNIKIVKEIIKEKLK